MKNFRLVKTVLMGSLAVGMTLAAATAAFAEDVTLRFATVQTPQYPVIVEIKQVMDEITEKTEGRVKFHIYYGSESGFQARQYVTAVKRGLLDGAVIPSSASALEFPWLGLFAVPLVSPSPDMREPIVNALRPMLEEFSHENGFVTLAYPLNWGQYQVIYTRNEVHGIEDFKGKLIRGYDPASLAIAEAVGGVPTSLQKSEVYLGLQRGTIDGAMTDESAAKDSNLFEVAKNMYLVDTLFLPNFVAFSEKTWQKLSEGDRKIMTDAFSEWEAHYWDIINDKERQAGTLSFAKEHGMIVSEPIPAVDTAVAGVKEQLIAKLVAEDPKTQQALDLLNGAIAAK